MYASVNELLKAYHRGERPKLGFDRHALERGVEMAAQLGLSPDEIRDAMLTPLHIGYSEKHHAVNLYGHRCTLGVIVNRNGEPFCKTILWKTKALWEASYLAGEPQGRERRENIELS